MGRHPGRCSDSPSSRGTWGGGAHVGARMLRVFPDGLSDLTLDLTAVTRCLDLTGLA